MVGVIQKEQTEQQILEYMDELEFLAETAGVKTVKRYTQKMAQPDSKTFIGKGKLEEVVMRALQKDATVLVFEVARQRSAGTGTQPVGG